MRLKRTISALLVIALLVSQFYGFGVIFSKNVYAASFSDAVGIVENNIAKKYFYNQLTDEAKVFYDGMDNLLHKNDYSEIEKELSKPETKFGVDSYDLTDKFNQSGNTLEQSLYTKLDAYTKGNQELLNLMATARDAWMADHAGVFYVDSSNITLRVTKDTEQKFHVFIGNGRTDTYINKTFWDSENKKVKTEELIEALKTVESEKNKIVEEVKAVADNLQAGQSLQEQQAKKAHDLIIRQNSYKLEETIIEENKTQGKNGDPYSVRNVYGAFKTHEIVCEGFARAFKMIMDDVNIPCVLVYGAFVSPNQYEEHMWNYIQLEDGKWYGVDLTWDNTDEQEELGWGETQERVSTEYFVAGSDKMDLNHLVTGTMSAAKYEFKYPELEKSSDRYTITSENAGLRVEIDTESYDEEEGTSASKFKVSYAVDLNGNGTIDPGERMGYQAAKQKGYYILAKYLAYNQGEYDYESEVVNGKEEGWSTGFFGYFNETQGFEDTVEENGDSYTAFYNANSEFIQFGVTDVANWTLEDVQQAGTTPESISRMTTYFGSTADLLACSELVFNPYGNYTAAPYIKRATPALNSTTYIGETYHCSVEYDDIIVPAKDKNIEDIGFKVTIEKSSNAENSQYSLTNFKFDGVSTFTFDFTPSEQWADDSVFYNIEFTNCVGASSGKKPMTPGFFCAHRCSAYAYKSQGFDWNVYGKPTLMDDVNLDNLTEEENEDLAELLKHRLTLVTTTTKPSEEKAMNDMLEENKEELNINGTVEKTETYNISLTLCKMQKIQDGQAVRVMLGFPAGYGPEDAGVTFKAYHYIKDEKGRITGIEEIPCIVTELGLLIECKSFSPFTIAAVKGEEENTTKKTVVFQTNEGGDVLIGEDRANSVVLDENEQNEVTLTIKPDEGYVVDDIVVGNKVIDLNSAEEISADDNNTKTYKLKYSDIADQEYQGLVAKVAFIPEITKQEEEEKGYEVVAQPLVAQPEFELATTTNKIINPGEEESVEMASSYNKDDVIEVTYSLTGMTNVGESGVKKFNGILKYNSDNLEYINGSIKDGNGWQNFNAIGADGTLVISGEDKSENKSSQIAEVFKLRFKVLKDVDAIETIILTEIKGDDGDGDTVPKCADTVTSIQIAKKVSQVEDKITANEGSLCEVKDGFVFGVKPGSTVNDLEKELSSEGNKLITYYGTKLVRDENGNIIDENQGISKNASKLTGDDILSTGATVKVGSKCYPIIMSGDVDGNGEFDMTDLALSLASYRDIEKLTGFYEKASDVDENGEFDMTDVANMLNYYRNLQDSPKPRAD